MHKVIIIGAGGHGKVVADAVIQSGAEVVGFLDDDLGCEGRLLLGRPWLGTLENIAAYAAQGCRFIIAIGHNKTRKKIAEAHNVNYYTAVHPRAVIAPEVSLGAGTVVMAGAIVNAGASVGGHCILNTSCVVEHDNRLGDFVHICPKAALAGTVCVGEGVQIGIGSAVSNNLSICGGCLIGAGAVVVRSIDEPGVYAGVPARLLRAL
ncbi:MAG: acetyltransferase [bacterium]|nr:acetyltransferase [bacterium]